MDNGLFNKYDTFLQQRENIVQELIIYIQETTGVLLTKEEIVLTKKSVIFQTSSVKKNVLIKKNTKDLLKKRGYIVKD
jgi:hypothetical protein